MTEPRVVLIRRCDGPDREIDMTQPGPWQDAMRQIWARRRAQRPGWEPGPEYDEAVSRSRARQVSSAL